MEQFGQELAIIAQKLGLASEHIWPQLVLITLVIAWLSWVFWLVCGLLLPIWACRHWGPRAYHWAKDNEENPEVIFLVFPVCLLVLLPIIAVIQLPLALAGIVAPEAKTVLDILNRVK